MMRTLDIRYPRSWAEVTPPQLLVIARTLSHSRGTRDEVLLRLLLALSGIRIPLGGRLREDVAEVRHGGHWYRVPVQTLLQASRELGWILDTNGLTACPLKGISPKLYDTKFEDYFAMDANMMRYSAGQAQDHRLAAQAARCLTHRRERMDGTRALAMLIWYNGLKHWLAERYPNVFEKGGGEPSGTMADVLSAMLSALNQDRPQDNDAILESETHAVLRALENIQLRYKSYEKYVKQGIR